MAVVIYLIYAVLRNAPRRRVDRRVNKQAFNTVCRKLGRFLFAMADDQLATVSKIIDANEQLQRAVNIPIESHSDGGWAIHLPGFKYDDFNRAGLLNIIKLDRASQTVIGIKTQTEIDELMFFVVGRHWTFSPKLYQRAAVDFPMTLRWTVTGLGGASVDHHHAFFQDSKPTSAETATATTADGDFSTPLACCSFRLVHVNPLTRKPSPLPDYFVAGAKQLISAGGKRFPSVQVPSQIPDHSFGCRLRVRFEDMDVLFHTNVSSYLGFALECAAQAATAGFYTAICGDVAFYRTKRATSVFISESRAGEELNVSTWEDEDNSLLLNFAISRNGKIINYAQIEFFDNALFAPSKL